MARQERSLGSIAGAITPRRLGFVAGIGCLLLSLAYLAVLRPALDTSSMEVQVSMHARVHIEAVQHGSTSRQSDIEMTILPVTAKEKKWDSKETTGTETGGLTLQHEETDTVKGNSPTDSVAQEMHSLAQEIHPQLDKKKGGDNSIPDSLPKEKQNLVQEMQPQLDEKKGGDNSMPDSLPQENQNLAQEMHPQLDEERDGGNSMTAMKMPELPLSEEKGIKNDSMAGGQLVQEDGSASGNSGTEGGEMPRYWEQGKDIDNSIAGANVMNTPSVSEEKPAEDKNPVSENSVADSKVECDLSGQMTDTCRMHGDIRIVGTSSSIIAASASQAENTWKLKPYARKWESNTMGYIKEVTVRTSKQPGEIPQCTWNHSIPAVVFSTGGFLGNIFHDFADVLIPLFLTSRQYNGEVQFLVTNYNSRWIERYQMLLKRLSHYDIINMDEDNRVHCFNTAHIGLENHIELGIDPSKSTNGYSMGDFRDFVMSSFSLRRKFVKRTDFQSGKKKPRLLILFRQKSRSFTNKRGIISMARSLGFKVISAGLDEMKDLSRFASIVNSCDVMMGVHGAGLTNMIFLPINATLIQVVPCCGMKWAAWHDYGRPTADMGVRYLGYEIKEEESTLRKIYPKNHAVFRDPDSIHRQGFGAIWSVYLNQQNVKLDSGRFKPVLLEALQFLYQQN